MAKKTTKNESSEPQDPREAMGAAGQELYETLSRGFSEAFGFLKELSSSIEERIEEAFKPGTAAPSKPAAKKAAANKPAAKKKAVAKKPAAKKKAVAKKAPAKKAVAKKKAPAKKKAAAKKAPAKKAVAKKKAPAKKKAVAKKKAPAKKAASGPTRDELYAQAQRLDIEGRSNMSKAQLQRAINAAKR